jgi:pSer/pThr/pTyr-binding forkhead associated (FHA) protein
MIPLAQNSRSVDMVTLTFHHQTGGRATEIDVVPLGAHRELILGRSSSAAVRFDRAQDRAVGRQHARVTRASDGTFVLTDLQSRNGTYLNGERLTASLGIHSGDVVQLGEAGPSVMILIDGLPPDHGAPPRHDPATTP